MISELNDEEILDFLMTSDFDGDYSPVELKYLLTKWRTFYRILYGKLELSKSENDGNSRNFDEELLKLKNYITNLQIDIVNKEDKILKLKNRKLTLKERFSGKIITKDEN